jgi:hypothetical protein
MVAEPPQFARLRPGLPGCRVECGLEIKRLGPLASLPPVKTLEEASHLVLVAARQRDVDAVGGPEVGQEASKELLVPRASDPVQREPEDACLLDADVEPGDRDRCQAESPRRHEALVATDDHAVLAPGEDRLNEAELAEAPGQ